MTEKEIIPQWKQVLKAGVIIATVIFTALELMIVSGLVTLQNSPLLPPNLQTQTNWYDNPIVWAIGAVIIVNFAGYIENTVINNQTYDITKFGETLYKYMPMMIIISQFLPNNEAAVLSFVLDYLKRTFQK